MKYCQDRQVAEGSFSIYLQAEGMLNLGLAGILSH
jgi:hypothetical protein